MMRLLIWVFALLLLLGWVFTPRPNHNAPPEQAAALNTAVGPVANNSVAQDIEPIGNGLAKVVIPRAADGHFYVDAQVGPAVVHFLVDTGATTVALTRTDAQRAGIASGAGDFGHQAETANGKVAVKPVQIDRIRIGPLEAQNVDGVVIRGDLPVSLLGQSWLRRVGSVTIKDDRLILN